jgi:hypothetical protein
MKVTVIVAYIICGFNNINPCLSKESPILLPFQSHSYTITEGNTFRLLCAINYGSKPMYFQWYKNGQSLLNGGKYRIETYDDSSKFAINSIDISDAANYSCHVSNSFGSISQSAILRVKAANRGVIEQQVPPYLRSSFIIPITVAAVIIVIAFSAAYAYISIEDRNSIKAKMLSGGPAKNFQYINTCTKSHPTGRQSVVSEEGTLSFRYSDSSDKTKPLMARPPIPTVLWVQHQQPIIEEEESLYSTLPFQKFSLLKTPPLPPHPHSNPFQVPESSSYAYDEKGMLCHSPPHSSSMFCKVDVHNQERSDSYDDFFRPQHV